MPPTPPPDTKKQQFQPLNILGGAIGAAAGLYCGFSILIPLIGAAIVFAQQKRFATKQCFPFQPAIAVIFGHFVWMLVGLIIVPEQFGAVALDMAIMIAGLIWLILRPGLGPVLLLGIFEVLCLVMNINSILPQEFRSPAHKALTAHIILRLAALATLAAGYLKFKKDQALARQSLAPGPGQPPPPIMPPTLPT